MRPADDGQVYNFSWISSKSLDKLADWTSWQKKFAVYADIIIPGMEELLEVVSDAKEPADSNCPQNGQKGQGQKGQLRELKST